MSVRDRFLRTAARAWHRVKYADGWEWILRSNVIEGWLQDSEAYELYRLAKHYTPETEPIVVELGSFKGKSSVMLAGGLKEKKNAKLYCIDPFGKDEDSDEQRKIYDPILARDQRGLREIFEESISHSGVSHLVFPIQGYSFEIVRSWNTPIDLLFIDASHAYPFVLRDFETWFPLVKPHGVVAFHDANGIHPGPTRVVAERLIAPAFSSVHSAGSVAWAQKL